MPTGCARKSQLMFAAAIARLADIKRAVKRLQLPTGGLQRQLVNEIDALIALDHPAIVRLIEYFVADSEVFLVMELLQGPSLGEKLRELGRFSETFAVRCLRHMLKALFCCHCHGIAHNDVSEENFRFETCRADAALRMVDFGLSEMSAQESAARSEHFPRGLYVQKRDIWSVGTILYQMLAGERLLPEESGSHLSEATNPSYVPSRLSALRGASAQARDLLAKMLEPSTDRRIAAQEALQHPLVVQSYALAQSEVPDDGTSPRTAASVALANRNRRRLAGCVPALCAFARAPRIKRLALLVAAHLLGDEVGGLRWLFRFLARDAWLIEESVFEEALREAGEEVPQDFAALFRSADLSGSGALNFVEFMAAMMASLPEVYSTHSSLKAVFHFFDSSGAGIIRGEHLHTLFPARTEDECALMIRQSCGKDSMSFVDFQRVMTPANWKPGERAKWADVPDVTSPVLGAKGFKEQKMRGSSSDPERDCQVTSRVTSAPSEAFAIRQKPGFHRGALRPFYAAQPVSNVVLGLAAGSSGYARRAVQLRCTELVDTEHGAFFFMPNPKYHWTPEAAFNDERKARFVAWWIHPDLCSMLRAWTAGTAGAPVRSVSRGDETGVGAPGDFGYSDTPKSPGYLHTCRDLCGRAHVRMLDALVAGIKTYLDRMFGGDLAAAHVSAGFHYPVRPQYSTLHLQIRVNAGDVCPGEGRGVDLFRLQNRLKADPECFQRDDETLFYEATANLRIALLKACDKATGVHGMGTRMVREVGPKSLVLGE
ncbi:CPK2 [Symbiodinium natans]|uniref:CPK2 protein n=1 Tax=Symbiodinium natans TaxID=878477 RepID=A0A812M8P9_9DINO|nr:CPK2 [Symbiodinium natans]